MAIAEMVVQIEGLREEDEPETLKVLGWGNLAQDIQQTYHTGDRVIIEGRLSMITVDRPEGFKEKRAELTAQRIHKLDASGHMSTHTTTPAPSTAKPPVAEEAPPAPRAPVAKSSKPAPAKGSPEATPKAPVYSSAPTAEPDYDDIPF